MSLRSLTPRVLVLALGAQFLLLSGCDLSGEYDARRKSSLTLVAAQSELTKHLGAMVTVPDPKQPGASTKVSFSPPKMFGTQPRQDADKLIAALSAVAKYELATSKGEGPCLYVCVLPIDIGPIDQVIPKLEEAIKLAGPNLAIEARDEELQSLTNAPLGFTFKHVIIKGMQKFIIEGKDNSLTAVEKGGILDIYIVPAPQHYVAFAFRATDEAANTNDLQNAVGASMRTVSIGP